MVGCRCGRRASLRTGWGRIGSTCPEWHSNPKIGLIFFHKHDLCNANWTNECQLDLFEPNRSRYCFSISDIKAC